eukprot:TRINITY_DN50121_c0_g1_i1.p2 TRINITY_DN50121_c0_g1~~TRINITY_DN50121_c0_g1_i1.p2  ORF type:complete len:136 (+),score=31.27 TRINITY_DN50121_c0_g1_i1:66-473(+)
MGGPARGSASAGAASGSPPSCPESGEVRTDPTRCKQLLADPSGWAVLCGEALEAQGNVIETPAALAKAMTHICGVADLEPIDHDEAADMFMPDLSELEFQHLCREYFASLCATLDCEDDFHGLLPTADAAPAQSP